MPYFQSLVRTYATQGKSMLQRVSLASAEFQITYYGELTTSVNVSDSDNIQWEIHEVNKLDGTMFQSNIPLLLCSIKSDPTVMVAFEITFS